MENNLDRLKRKPSLTHDEQERCKFSWVRLVIKEIYKAIQYCEKYSEKTRNHATPAFTKHCQTDEEQGQKIDDELE